MQKLTADEARGIVENYMQQEGTSSTTQEILDSGAVPRLSGYHVVPGKASDLIFGGKYSYRNPSTVTI